MAINPSLLTAYVAFLFTIYLLITPTYCQINQYTTITQGSTRWYPTGTAAGDTYYTVRSDAPGAITSTITQTAPGNGAVLTTTTTINARAIPTLVYNCAYMPFICQNVANWMTANNQQFTNGLYELIADVQSDDTNKRTARRKAETCENVRSIYGAAGAGTQCANAGAANNIANLFSTSFASLPAQSVPGRPNEVLGPVNAQGNGNDPSGLIWTCDEFPSSSWILGGRGVPQANGGFAGTDSTVICAPQGAECSKTQRVKAAALAIAQGRPVPVPNKSEQNWQGSALTGLRAALKRLHGARATDFVAVFYLSTTTDAALPATSRAWLVDEVRRTRVFSRALTPTDMPELPEVEDWRDSPAVSAASTLQTVSMRRPKQTAAPAPLSNLNIPKAFVVSVPEVPEASFDIKERADSHEKRATAPMRKRFWQHVPRNDNSYQLRGRQVQGSEIAAAQLLVKEAQEKAAAANRRIMAHPRTYDSRKLFRGEEQKARNFRILSSVSFNDSIPQPTAEDYLPVNDTVKAAAALVAEYSARSGLVKGLVANQTSAEKHKRQDSSFWMTGVKHGSSPFNPTEPYTVFRNVADYGIFPDGSDVTQKIIDLMKDGDRCGANCGSTSVAGAILYFPGGTYLISSPIVMYFMTQFVGDPNNRPTFVAAPGFVGLAVIEADFYYPEGNGESWYINQSNFLRQVRNIIIDIRNIEIGDAAGLHWQVAQGTSLQNVDFLQGDFQVGIFMENGSGGLITDVNFFGGGIGMKCGNQQYTTRNLVFRGCDVAINMIWDWGWTWKSLDISGSRVGMQLIDPGSSTRTVYSILLLDSKISATTGIVTQPLTNTNGSAQITLDNVNFAGSGTAIGDTSGNSILSGGPQENSWARGVIFNDDNRNGMVIAGDISPVRDRPTGLLGGPNGGYFERSKPQYEGTAASAFKNALDNGCKGDGQSDDTACLRSLFATPGLVFLPAGVYIVTDTIPIVSGVKIVGELWSQIMASGNNFSDKSNPRVMVQVGQTGQSGDVEMQDLMFTVKGAMAGAVLLEWNLRSSSAGAASMWDCHFRVGGALGSDLQVANCPKLSGSVNPDCIAASMLMHVTQTGSGYFENVWAWVADHDLDIKEQTQIDIYVARGLLIESINPTWMYGTASEHCVLYQYQLFGARNLFMGLIQTESPYFQATPKAPEPFTDEVGQYKGDPDFADCPSDSPSCAFSWGLRVQESRDVLIYGLGLYSWFQEYVQECLGIIHCQDRMIFLQNDRNLYLYNLVTVGVESMVTAPAANVSGIEFYNPGSNVSSINAWLGQAEGSDSENGNAPGGVVYLDPSIYVYAGGEMSPMTAACIPPCILQLPPITYPRLQPPPITTTWDGQAYTVTPPALTDATLTVDPIFFGSFPPGDVVTTRPDGSTTTITSPTGSDAPTTTTSSGVVIVVPESSQTEIPVPPWDCGDDCGGHRGVFPPIPIPWPGYDNGGGPKCIWFCDSSGPKFPPLVVITGPPPGPPPPADIGETSNGGEDDPDDEEDDDDDEDEEEEEEESCVLRSDADNIDTPDENGNTAAGEAGHGSNSGGNVGAGGVNGGGVGYPDGNGGLAPTPVSAPPHTSSGSPGGGGGGGTTTEPPGPTPTSYVIWIDYSLLCIGEGCAAEWVVFQGPPDPDAGTGSCERDDYQRSDDWFSRDGNTIDGDAPSSLEGVNAFDNEGCTFTLDISIDEYRDAAEGDRVGTLACPDRNIACTNPPTDDDSRHFVCSGSSALWWTVTCRWDQ